MSEEPYYPVNNLAVYTRISQDKTGAGMSVDNQLASITKWAEKNGHTLGTHYSDNDISAYSGKVRPSFTQLLADAPEAVVCWHQDRLLRVSADLELVLTTEMTVYQVQAGSLDLATPQGRAVARTVAAWSTYEIEQKGARQKLRSSADAEAGKWNYSRPVFGNDSTTGALMLREAEAIREAARGYIAGDKSFWQIAKDWNAQGFRTPRSKGAGGKEWEVGTVRRFFESERLMGKRTYEGTTRTMVGWEPVLDEETFESVRTLINAGKTGKRGVSTESSVMHLLTGICRCGVDGCGKGMNIGYRGGPGSPRYYKCTTPNHLSRTAEPLERYVVELFLYLLASPGAEDVVNPDSARNEVGALRTEKARLTTEYAVWVGEAMEADLSPGLLKAKETKHEERLAEIEARLMEFDRQNLFDGLIYDYAAEGSDGAWERWTALPRTRQRKVVEALISQVKVHRAPQGTRFSGKHVTVSCTPLMLKLIDAAEASTTVLTQEQYESLGDQNRLA